MGIKLKHGLVILFGSLLMLNTFPTGAIVRDEGTIGSTAQDFERGTMIWRADTGDIYALADDGQAWSFAAVAYGSLPMRIAQGTATRGRDYPTNGFLRVWANYPDVRNALGWATTPEIGFLMPVVSDTDTGHVYLKRNEGLVYQLNLDATWNILSNMPETAIAAPFPISIGTFDVTPDYGAEAGDYLQISWEIYGPADGVLVEISQTISPHSTPPILSFYPIDTSSVRIQIPTGFIDDVRVAVSAVTLSGDPYYTHDTLDLIIDVQPSGEAQTVYAAYQHYDNGFMIWRSDTGNVYIGMEDGRVERYGFYADYAGPPTDLGVPTNRYVPVNAFGKIWWTGDRVRARLGWATTAEVGYDMTIETLAARIQAFSLPNGTIIHIDESRHGLSWREG